MGKKAVKKHHKQSRALLKKELEKKERKAEKLLCSAEGFEKMLVKTDLKITKTVRFLHDVIDDLRLFFELVRDVVRNHYTDIPIGSVIIVAGALLYFLAPLDVVPDFFPAIGFTDDISVILLVIRQVKNDLEAYKQWRKKKRKSFIH
ncbi:MAG: DUF1232 domain-containing protein [Spirochaetales bacterium]|nr:DUF1232 domain-containing protein [Spirochaetales bacterium]